MSLEIKIEELTRAIITLTQAIQAQQPIAPIVPEKQGARVKKEKEVAVEPAVVAESEVEIPTLKEAQPKDVTPKSTDTSNVEVAKERTYAELAIHLGRLMSLKGRNALVDLLAEFDAPNGKALKPEQYADVWAKAEALMGE